MEQAKFEGCTPELKAQVALAALKGTQTEDELAHEYCIHLEMVGRWRRQLVVHAVDIFEDELRLRQLPVDMTSIYARIGELSIENEFLKSEIHRVGLHTRKM